MMLNMRGWSLNQYCLSKVWFRTHSIDIRLMDENKITSLVKSWLYADMLLKPEEMIMYRPPSYGGLGIHNVKLKAQAGLIKSFLETAGHSKFIQSLYHNVLYRYHVNDETSLPNPGFPPYYSKDFFRKIRQVHHESPLNIFQMSEKMWYTLLLEDSCTMEEGEQGQVYIECRVERANQNVDWEHSWRLARLSGLGPENVSFLFKLLHQLLPTQERVARTKPGTSPNCRVQGCQNQIDNIEHALIFCQSNDGVGLLLLRVVRGLLPEVEATTLSRLELQVDPDQELPLVFFISTVLCSIWTLRQSGQRVQRYLVRSEMEAKINLLRETRHSGIVSKLEEFTISLHD